MKTAFILTLLFFGSMLFSVQAATLPATVANLTIKDSLQRHAIINLTPKAVEAATGKKLRWLEKLQLKMLQKKLKKYVPNEIHPISKSTKVLSVLSLITGALGLVVLFVGFGWGVLLFTLASIITGIIALSGNKNKGNKFKTMAIIGLVLSGLTVVITIVAVIALAIFWGGVFGG